jgi:hypothetical protein
VARRSRPYHLCEPRQSWRHAPPEIARRIRPTEPPNIGLHQRPGPDGAQFPAKHVDELWQLVEAGGAEQPADSGHLLIPHRAELEDRERTPSAAEPCLAEQQRPPVGTENRGGNRRHDRREEHQAADGANTSNGRFSRLDRRFITNYFTMQR